MFGDVIYKIPHKQHVLHHSANYFAPFSTHQCDLYKPVNRPSLHTRWCHYWFLLVWKRQPDLFHLSHDNYHLRASDLITNVKDCATFLQQMVGPHYKTLRLSPPPFFTWLIRSYSRPDWIVAHVDFFLSIDLHWPQLIFTWWKKGQIKSKVDMVHMCMEVKSGCSGTWQTFGV